MKTFFLKYKTYIILSVIAIFILIYTQFSTIKKSGNPTQTPLPGSQGGFTQQVNLPTPTPLVFSPPPYSEPTLNSQGQITSDTAQMVNVSTVNKNKIKSSLPIYIKDFQVSNGMKTTLNIYTVPEDPDYQIHIEIYGIDFEDQTASKENNPNVVAFIESFQEVKKQLAFRDVDIHNIYFVFGQRTYIQATADLWIKTFSLL